MYLYELIRGVCNFLGSVSLQQKFEPMDRAVLQPCIISSDGPVLQLYYSSVLLASKGKYILNVWGCVDPKDVKKREAPWPNFGFSFYVSSPPPGPALCKLD